MKNRVLIGIIVLIVMIIVAVFIMNNSNGSNNSKNAILTANAQLDNYRTINNPNFIAINELNKHKNMEDCWVAYKGKVYDVTDWLPKHPGSAGAILPYCGTAKEFEDAFTKKHGTTKAGLLMKIGVLMGDFETQGNLNEN